MLSQEQILLFLRNEKPFLKSKFHINEIGLFGSYARNEATEKSDIDLLVVIDENIQNYHANKNELRAYLEKKLNHHVDLARPGSLKPHFKDRILKQAIYA